MSVNGVTNSTQTYDSKSTTKTKDTEKKTTGDTSGIDSTAVVYEKSDRSTTEKKVYKTDTATIERLKAEADQRYQSLRDLVEKMLVKQGKTFSDATDIYALLRAGKVEIDPETSAKAKEDVAEDGYWGVEKTSERMLSFAKALTGGDTSKADDMIKAIKKGFDQATKAWGDDLPDICKTTMQTTIKKLEAWRDGLGSSDSMSNEAEDTITGQAAASTIAK
jgi:hypothetical protein